MDPFIGEIRLFGFGFAPRGWAFCAGQTISITQNTALYSLIGITYGGNGINNFGLPNLQNVLALDAGQGTGLSSYQLGQRGGTTTVTLQDNQMPSHSHGLMATSANGSSIKAAGNVLAAPQVGERGRVTLAGVAYSTKPITGQMNQSAISPNGSGGSHNNVQPFLVLNYCIALVGVFPPRP